MFFAKDWNPDGLHCYVTGGSTGLGLELAKLLVQKGAHVSIVARNQERLDKALAELEISTLRTSPGQQLHAYSFSLYTAADSAAALTAACAPHGGNSPDAVFACAGSARPMYFVEMTEEDMRRGMDDAYWVQVGCGRGPSLCAAVKQMVKQNRKGRLALVSSVVGYMSFLGWGSPSRHPQSELMLYPSISVHIYFPGSMLTPGFEEEQRDKPQISKGIDNAQSAITPDVAARAFLRGVEKGQAHITSDFVGSLFRASTHGVAPRRGWWGWVRDAVLDGVAYVRAHHFPSFLQFLPPSPPNPNLDTPRSFGGTPSTNSNWLCRRNDPLTDSTFSQFVAPIWRSGVDRRVRAAGPEHRANLQKRGFFD
ncbi:hypothetical protein B0H19DRAFT_1269315 [Mycena capillaripes]|nr:hypothetical protein B0H19DRAFT_1269315 [Mycena capillaripes]